MGVLPRTILLRTNPLRTNPLRTSPPKRSAERPHLPAFRPPQLCSGRMGSGRMLSGCRSVAMARSKATRRARRQPRARSPARAGRLPPDMEPPVLQIVAPNCRWSPPPRRVTLFYMYHTQRTKCSSQIQASGARFYRKPGPGPEMRTFETGALCQRMPIARKGMPEGCEQGMPE